MGEVNHKWQRVGVTSQGIEAEQCVRCPLQRLQAGRVIKYARPGEAFRTMREVPDCDPRPKSERKP